MCKYILIIYYKVYEYYIDVGLIMIRNGIYDLCKLMFN